jgi:hypothetical protein
MAKKASKRRVWTNTDIRELKTMAKNKVQTPKIAKKLKRTLRCYPSKSVQLRRFAGFTLSWELFTEPKFQRALLRQGFFQNWLLCRYKREPPMLDPKYENLILLDCF